ncbi:hypothetical protein B0H19DRAFT_1076521 [Mycena capillaripes]|nr:hypothetical protein B0H19DRAFT_1076521 [Mycena capillaripes]
MLPNFRAYSEEYEMMPAQVIEYEPDSPKHWPQSPRDFLSDADIHNLRIYLDHFKALVNIAADANPNLLRHQQNRISLARMAASDSVWCVWMDAVTYGQESVKWKNLPKIFTSPPSKIFFKCSSNDTPQAYNNLLQSLGQIWLPCNRSDDKREQTRSSKIGGKRGRAVLNQHLYYHVATWGVKIAPGSKIAMLRRQPTFFCRLNEGFNCSGRPLTDPSFSSGPERSPTVSYYNDTAVLEFVNKQHFFDMNLGPFLAGWCGNTSRIHNTDATPTKILAVVLFLAITAAFESRWPPEKPDHKSILSPPAAPDKPSTWTNKHFSSNIGLFLDVVSTNYLGRSLNGPSGIQWKQTQASGYHRHEAFSIKQIEVDFDGLKRLAIIDEAFFFSAHGKRQRHPVGPTASLSGSTEVFPGDNPAQIRISFKKTKYNKKND